MSRVKRKNVRNYLEQRRKYKPALELDTCIWYLAVGRCHFYLLVPGFSEISALGRVLGFGPLTEP